MVIVLKLQNQIAGIVVSDVYKLEWQDLQNLEEIDDGSSELQKFIRGIFPENRWLINLKALAETVQWETY